MNGLAYYYTIYYHYICKKKASELKTKVFDRSVNVVQRVYITEP